MTEFNNASRCKRQLLLALGGEEFSSRDIYDINERRFLDHWTLFTTMGHRRVLRIYVPRGDFSCMVLRTLC